jgi:ubiquitin carboxyl-terminal hydrolase 14
MKAVPELENRLKKFDRNNSGDGSSVLTGALKDVFVNLEHSRTPVDPFDFLQQLRVVYPQFAQKDENQRYRQQDAEECWGQIFYTLKESLRDDSINHIFGGETVATLKCAESDAEPVKQTVEKFNKLSCHINSNTSFLLQGLKESMSETITKRSDTLNREALYENTIQISKLPRYLTVHFVRFFWKNDVKLKAKILKPVDYPFTLDVYELCTDELKEHLAPKRKEIADIEAQKPKDKKTESASTPAPALAPESDKMDFESTVPQENNTGHYELRAVLTHKGRMADSGHYVAWVKGKDNNWYKFDDDVVSVVPQEEIRKLTGATGGDWHMAYLVLYESKHYK